MKTICLIGPVDKRAIAYPLIKCLTELGRALIITDDSVYRRFSDNYDTEFSYSNSEFRVVTIVDEEVIKEVEQVKTNFEYVLYITTSELPDGCDKVIYAHGVGKSFLGEDLVSSIENKECREVIITMTPVKDKTIPKITPDKTVMSYIYACEEHKEFLPSKDSGFITMVTTLFEEELEVPKNTIRGLLLRKG